MNSSDKQTSGIHGDIGNIGKGKDLTKTEGKLGFKNKLNNETQVREHKWKGRELIG